MTGAADLLALCPRYAETPLREVVFDGRRVLVKDESARMGLGSFKALGGIYAVARLLEQATGVMLDSAAALDRMRGSAADQAFVCASAGNHGLAVATGARLFGAAATVVLSDAVPEAFADRLRARGAEVLRRGATYEDSVASAIAFAEQSGAIHLADSSWPGYTEPPRLVMEGYAVLADEMQVRFDASGDWPDHVYLQAGVGGLAAAVARQIRTRWSVQPRITVVEPDAAACLARSHAAGRLVTARGPVSSMGRLDCKEPSMLAFDILRTAADRFVTVTDAQAEEAATRFTATGLPTTPSGAAGLAACLTDGAAGRPLVILSEGAVAG
ncbi:PLP-dependent lyase/thiolase [Primorskyibacter flagellatus]|uniref:PLP-dependent lyase/thiolase n=1 Tax=Primorskyibacter flagellatus TaxID=1387277 RepID=A0A917EIJ8_9RHOB|nr:pyridoxal-phosphate dependent enzyme [Primorskyibacter flagellatus]GGE45245.1 PLP-dependent lyase/thiolase [Primorskyibacter flagellatus]